MYRSLSVLLLIFLTAQLHGQQLYQKGYILNSPLDTIHGEVKYISYNQAAKRCVFKNENGEETTYSPSDIYGYGIANKLLFIAKKKELSEPLFLEVLYQGSVTLYGYRETSSRNYFYLESNSTGEFRPLTEKTIRRFGRQRTVRTFAQVITLMLPKSELVKDEIASASLTAKSLVNLLADYDQRYANTQGIVYTRKQNKTVPQIGVFAGLGLSRLELNGHRGRSNSSIQSIGLRLEKEISKGTKRLFIDADLMLTREKHDYLFEASQEVFRETDIVTNFLNFALPAALLEVNGMVNLETRIENARTLISAPVNLKYKIPGRRWNATFGGGLNVQVATSDRILVNGRVLEEDEVIFEIENVVESNPFRFGIEIGVGVAYNGKHTIFLDLRHSPPWLDQSVLNYAYTRAVLGVMLSKNK